MTLRFRMLAALVSLVYLSAAFGDCERPVFTPVGVMESAHGSEGGAGASPSVHSSHSSHGAHAGAPMSHHEGPTSRVAGTRDLDSGDAKVRRRGSARPLELQAKCLCGCDETRSTIGGGASRLGSTIPAVFVASLPPAPTERGFVSEPGRFTRMPQLLDPIPI